MQTKSEHEAHHGSDHNEDQRLGPAAGNDDAGGGSPAMEDGGPRYGCAGIAADQRVRGRGWQAQQPGDDIPDDSAQQPGQNDVLGDDVKLDHAAANRLGNGGSKQERGQEVEHSRPDYGQPRGEHASRDDRRDAVGRVVKAVQKVKNESGDDGNDQQNQSCAHEGTSSAGFWFECTAECLKRSLERLFPAHWRHLRLCRWLLPGFPGALSV